MRTKALQPLLRYSIIYFSISQWKYCWRTRDNLVSFPGARTGSDLERVLLSKPTRYPVTPFLLPQVFNASNYSYYFSYLSLTSQCYYTALSFPLCRVLFTLSFTLTPSFIFPLLFLLLLSSTDPPLNWIWFPWWNYCFI